MPSRQVPLSALLIVGFLASLSTAQSTTSASPSASPTPASTSSTSSSSTFSHTLHIILTAAIVSGVVLIVAGCYFCCCYAACRRGRGGRPIVRVVRVRDPEAGWKRHDAGVPPTNKPKDKPDGDVPSTTTDAPPPSYQEIW
ncbi:hypothetical protein K438DRAFT_1770054 [Mycena galopus ATCC 62051]|nr:hypothetical protein K438DRAFT_1770054 [Mycena galopus ATCC 62051]